MRKKRYSERKRPDDTVCGTAAHWARTALLVAVAFVCCGAGAWALGLNRGNIETLDVSDGLSGNEANAVYCDRDGFVWVATKYGINLFDGYSCKSFKSDLLQPDLLSSNDVKCIAEDGDGQIWFGTTNGINVFNKTTGRFWRHDLEGVYNKSVSCLLAARDGTVWIGTESGLCSYDGKSKSFKLYSGKRVGAMSGKPIKCLLEDSRGDIWIGTWDAGLFRYSPSQRRFFAYPKMNERNSAHVLYEDRRGNIWVAGWDCGLCLLQNPYDLANFSWREFRHSAADAGSIGDDLIYSMGTDVSTGDMWVGTRSGLSVMSVDAAGAFTNYTVGENFSCALPYGEICSVKGDEMGDMWLATVNNGVMMVRRSNKFFSNFSPRDTDGNVLTSSVTRIYVDEGGNVWCGLSSQGFTVLLSRDRAFHHFYEMDEFKGITQMAAVYSFMHRKAGDELWIGTYGDGLVVYEQGKPVRTYNMWNCDFLKDDCVLDMLEDRNGSVWFGGKSGLSVLLADGTGYKFSDFHVEKHDFNIARVNGLAQDTEGRVWLSTYGDGVVCLSGDMMNPAKLHRKAYGKWNGKLPTSTAHCIYVDSKGRIWLGTANCGLLRYDGAKDRFVEAGEFNRLLSDRVMSVCEDDMGNLWLATANGIACINPDDPKTDVKLFSTANGLASKEYMINSSCFFRGQLYFGGNSGLSSFMPAALLSDKKSSKLFFTDFRFAGRSVYDMTPGERQRYCDAMPMRAKKLVVPSDCSVLTIEFSSLMYSAPRQTRYAYMLEGVDKDWHYTTIGINSVSYSNLRGGKYKFRLRAANENGVWSGEAVTLDIEVQSPWYATWTAIALYILGAAGLIILFIVNMRRQQKLSRSLYLKNVERDSLDRLNHAKMQFFTNITHELLTPLSIISASIDELKNLHADGGELYEAMTYNVNRLLRLLQQILDFRKAETGNLRLRVRYGELIAFMRKCTEEFIPLMKRYKLDFRVSFTPDVLYGYYDSDKVEKILYNLLSNAAKYNHEGGFVHLDIQQKDKKYVLITVTDNGRGMSKKECRNVFKRFYDGEKVDGKVAGNGIGLSLTHDIVKLYSGEITFDSEEGRGTEFRVTLPIAKEFFMESEIAEESIVKRGETAAEAGPSSSAEALEAGKDDRPTVLLVEDNEDLLQVMTKLLGHDYNVLTAANGKLGIEVVKSNYVNIIVSDVMMPEMNGMVFCKFVKDSIDYCHIPVILLTALTTDEDKVEAYESGADAYITKPFDMMVLKARIKNLLKVAERNARNFQKNFSVEGQVGIASIDEAFMQKIMECIKSHYDDSEFDQQRLFEEMAVSKSTLYRKLKTLTGMSPSSLIRKYRLETARRMIESNPRVRVSELAYSVGFNDPKYFSSIFKKEYGKLPSEMQE